MAPFLSKTTRAYAVGGVLAAAAAMGAGHLVAAFVAPSASPVASIGARVIDATPTPVKEWAVATLGTFDKPVLLGAVIGVTLALTALVGAVARRQHQVALLLVGVLGAIAAWSASARSSAGPLDALPGIVAGVVGMLALHWLATRADTLVSAETAPPPGPGSGGTAYAPGRPATPGRRSFVRGATGIGAGAVGAAVLGEILPTGPGNASPPVALPSARTPLPPLATGLEGTVPGISPLRTPTADFYRIDTALTIPRIDASTWKLTIDGRVPTPVSLSLDDLTAMDVIDSDVTINCVSNEVGGPYIGSTRWTGVLVRDVLRLVGLTGPAAGVEQILSTSVDGMTISTPIEALTDDRGALLAFAMDGQPLPAEHGYPVRLITPGLYGFVGATKWVTSLTATTYADQPAYWTVRGWAERSPVLTQARIDTPRPGAGVRAGKVAIGGVAWSQAQGGISIVEVRVGDQPWERAQLGPEVGPAYWRQWWLPWQATAGTHKLTVRATDAAGQVQTDTIADPFPKGATGLHSIEVQVS